MERKVGEIFTYNGKTYQVIKANTCKNCAFFNTRCNFFQTLVAGTCTPGGRKDNISVSFKLINNMENNQLTIDIPEGMEIDLENSDLAKGIIKFKNSNITYKDITDTIRPITYTGISVYSNYMSKLKAISQLMNIAKYYNEDWEPDWVETNKPKYLIAYRSTDNTYIVDYNYDYVYNYVYFKNKKDAIAVINNPNFRDILDKIYKNQS